MSESTEHRPERSAIAAALTSQQFVGGNERIALGLAEAGRSVEFNDGDLLMIEGGTDHDVYFIIDGTVDILVGGNVVASRSAGTHVGEMALIDPRAKRSASVVAKGPVSTWVVDEPSFSAVAERVPMLWRRLAVEMAERLRQYNEATRAANATK